uniref:CSON003668 protein n=1 Tax=Culicoides sonorensis TaxID=179676 RepID=A0A336LIB0_CULSO
MSRDEKRLKSSVIVVKKEHKSEPPDKFLPKNNKNDELEEGEIIDQAIAEIERESKIARIRAESSGTWHCSLRKTNKSFLKRALSQTISHNNRTSERHRDRSVKKLEQLERHRKKYPIEKFEDGRHYVRNPFVRRTTRELRHRYVDSQYERLKIARRKEERLPPREPPIIKFVKPRDLDERVLIPGQPKQVKVKKISFVTPNDCDDKYLGHDGRDLYMERIRQKIGVDKIPKQTFVPPEDAADRFFLLAGNKVAGLIRAVDYTE